MSTIAVYKYRSTTAECGHVQARNRHTCERLHSLTASCSVPHSSGTPGAFFLAHCFSSALPAEGPFDLKQSEFMRQSTYLLANVRRAEL